MKILFMTHIPAPYRVDFFNELGKLCDLTVLFERQDASDRESRWFSNSEKYFKAEYLEGKKYGTESALCLGVTKWLHKGMFDAFVVGIYSTLTGMLAIETLKSRKIPFILSTDGGFIKNDSKLKYFMKNHFIKGAKYYLGSGNMARKYFKYYGNGVNEIYDYPFTSLYQSDILDKVSTYTEKTAYRKKLCMNEDKILLSIGRFIYGKGFDVLMEACSKLPKEYGVYIVGGVPTQKYIDLKEEYKLDNIHFIDFKDKEELVNYYMASDLFVLPTREDTWGLVINEAMARGLPVVTTDRCIAGIELVNDENGRLITIDDTHALANAIKDILSDEQMLRRMSNKSLEKIRPYTIENMAKVHMDIFEYILTKEKVKCSQESV